MARLLGKVAVITGAGSGIGRASAALFAREWAVVVMADVKGDAVEAAAAEIAAAGIAGCRAEPVVADVSKEADVRALIDGAVARHGRLDILYNNAGGATGRDGKVTEMPLDEFRSEEHTSELQSLMRISYAVFCLKKNIEHNTDRVQPITQYITRITSIHNIHKQPI